MKKHLRPQGAIVREMVLGLDKFYRPERDRRRLRTSTGTEIIYPGSLKRKNKRSGRTGSFLWDSEWKSNPGSQPVSPYSESDDAPVFDEDIVTADERRNLRRINTISAHSIEMPKIDNELFTKCIEYDPLDEKISNTSKNRLSLDNFVVNEYFDILSQNDDRKLESCSNVEYAEIIDVASDPVTVESEENDLGHIYANQDVEGENLIKNESKDGNLHILPDTKHSESVSTDKSNYGIKAYLKEKENENKPLFDDSSSSWSSTDDMESLDLESSISKIRKLHLQIDALTEDLIRTSPKKKINIDPNEVFILAERCLYEEGNSANKLNYLIQLKLEYDDYLSLKSCRTLPQAFTRRTSETYSKRKRSKSTLSPKYKFQKTSHLNKDCPKSFNLSNVRKTLPYQRPSVSVDNLTLERNSTEVSNASL